MIEDGPHINYPVLENSLIRMILNAKKTIKLTSPYFILTDALLAAIRSASLSGVEIEIYIPGFYDKKSAYAGNTYYGSQLLEYNVKMYYVNDIFLHAKAGIFDNEYAYVGNMNFDVRSLYSQFEIISIFTGNSVREINNIFKEYKFLSSAVPKRHLKTKGLFYRVKTTFIKIMTPLM
jgi:cardiolipin synthase